MLTDYNISSLVMNIITSSYTNYTNEKEYSHDELQDTCIDKNENFDEYKSLFSIASQVLANYSSCKPGEDISESDRYLTASTMWNFIGVTGFSQLLNIQVTLKSQNGLAATFAALYNCLLVPNLDVASEVISCRQLCCQMALSTIDMQFANMKSTVQTNCNENSPPNVEWFYIVVMYLFKNGNMLDLLRIVRRTEEVLLSITGHEECFSLTMTHEEIIYICTLEKLLNDESVLKLTLQNKKTYDSLICVLTYLTGLLIPSGTSTSMCYPEVCRIDASSIAVDEKYAKFLFSLRPKALSTDISVTDIESLSTPAASVCISVFACISAFSNSSLSCHEREFTSGQNVSDMIKSEMLRLGAMNICCSYLTGLNKTKTGLEHICC